MQFPIDIHIGPIFIPSHFLFDIFSFYLGFRYYLYLNKKQADVLPENNRWYIIMAGALGALIGSRFLAALERPDQFFHPDNLLFYYGNKTIVGGLLGGILGVEIIKKFIGEKKRSGDLFTYPLILGIMIGRVGCFLTGIKDSTVGLPSSLPWAFDQGDGIARHPTALYEILFLGIVWLTLIYLRKKVMLKNGSVFRIFITSYLAFRFFVEFIKPIQPIAFGLSAIQIACALFVLFYLIQFAIPFLARPKPTPKLQ
jgi:prolipoprotein diacylglyceryltransferase